MGYSLRSGKWAESENAVIQGAVTRTASLVGNGVEVHGKGIVCLDLNVTAASGTTPTLDVAIETSKDGTNWRSLGSFAQKTGVSSERKSFVGVDRFIRANAAIGGTTPSFTYSVSGEAK